MRRLLIAVTVAVVAPASATVHAEELPGPEQLLARSIAHHDPGGVWGHRAVSFGSQTIYSPELAELRGVVAFTSKTTLDPGHARFRLVRDYGERVVEYVIDASGPSVLLDGSDRISDADREMMRIGEPEGYRDYCEFVFGLPMKLTDPGTRLGEVTRVEFAGQQTLALRVTWDPEVGTDVWIFYFDPRSFALVGSRFHHDEEANDGEFIVYGGEVVDPETGLRLPRAQSWYYNSSGGHLATDTILDLNVGP